MHPFTGPAVDRTLASRNPTSAIRKAYTLVEMLTTVAVLIIVLGLMVSLARYVRNRAAENLTKELLGQLDTLMGQYRQRAGGLPPVTALFPVEPPDTDAPDAMAPMPLAVDSAELHRNARRNSEDFVRAFRQQHGLSSVFADKPLAVYDELTLRDAWGSPIVFMPSHHPQIGMAPAGHFFFSAGPDRLYLTRDDNLYSYEVAPP